jgi:hypothetical protein
MRVKYCHRFSQNVLHSGLKVSSSLKQNLAEEARVSQGEETRQLAPKSSSDHVRRCLNASALTATFQFVSGGSS